MVSMVTVDRQCSSYQSWWRHQMKTFSALLTLCAGNSPVTGEFSSQRPVTRRFGVFFDLRLSKLLSKQSWGGWFETHPRSLWRHCNELSGRPTSNFCHKIYHRVISPQNFFDPFDHEIPCVKEPQFFGLILCIVRFDLSLILVLFYKDCSGIVMMKEMYSRLSRNIHASTEAFYQCVTRRKVVLFTYMV